MSLASGSNVVRTLAGAGFTDVALVLTRTSDRRHRLGRHHDADRDTVVLHHRALRPLLELAAREAYAGQRERAATYADRDHLWYFVTTTGRRDGTVAVSLFDRWLDGRRLRCEERGHRVFDSPDAPSSAASIDFTAGLQAWAEQSNDAREARCREIAEDELLEAERSGENAAGARALAALLAGVSRRQQVGP